MEPEFWAIVGVGATVVVVGAALLGVILTTWNASRTDNREAHKQIGARVDDGFKRVDDGFKVVNQRVDDGFKVVNSDIKDLIGDVGLLKGRQTTTGGRPSDDG